MTRQPTPRTSLRNRSSLAAQSRREAPMLTQPSHAGDRPPLTVEQILTWAEQHRARTGAWPPVHGGPVAGVGGLTWLAVDSALRRGLRGLPGGDSLPRL